jgi:signal transduction histidine kinase
VSRRLRLIGAVLLVAFWGAAAVPAVGGAVRGLADRATADRLDRPVGEAVLALEAERRLTVTGPPVVELNAQRARTDEAADRLRRADRSWLHRLTTSDIDGTADELLTRMAALPALRADIDAGRLDPRRTVTAYAGVIDPVGAGAPTVRTGPRDGAASGIVALSRSREILAEQDALLAATSAGRGPSPADRIRLTQLAGARRDLFTAAGAALPERAARHHRDLAAGPALARLRTIEDRIAGAGNPDTSAWAPTFNELNTALWDLRDGAGREAADAATARAVTATVWAGTVGGIGLVAVIALLIAARRGRATADMVMESSAAVARHRPDDLLHDLDRRNQGLLHRQVRLLDALARRAADPETAADLRRAGNLGTRLRRNVEKGITLAGGTPHRTWPRLVPMTDVLHEACAGIGDHERVTVETEPTHLAGTAVIDVTHLLAELLENAATFAPADSRITLAGRHEPTGYLITVTDAGPGMTAGDLATGHEVMATAEPPPGGTWWGLWAAGRFAARQDVTVELADGPGGGLVAAVRIPSTLVTGMPENEPRADLQAVSE